MANHKTNNPDGRPPKYKSVEELQNAIDEYFAYCDARIIQVFSKKIGDVIEVNEPEPYTMAGLAYALGLSRQGLMEYKNKNKLFSDAIKKARDKVHKDVERRLMEGNSTGAIFNLKNNFGWKDRQEVEQTINLPQPILGGNIDVPKNNSTDEDTESN